MDRNDTANEQVSAARDDAAELVERGMAHFEGGHYQEALALFQQAAVVAPGYAPAYNGIGRVYYHIGSPEAAIAAYEQAIACDPQEEAPYVGLAILLFARLGHYEDALAALARGQAMHPSAGVFPDLCSTVYLRMERYEEALSSAKLCRGIGSDAVQSACSPGPSLFALARLRQCRSLLLPGGGPQTHRTPAHTVCAAISSSGVVGWMLPWPICASRSPLPHQTMRR